jgi:hypothetical protein
MANAAVRRSGFASAFKPLPVGSVAYQTLIELANQAERSLDVQTFVVLGDAACAGVLLALRDVAEITST